MEQKQPTTFLWNRRDQ